MEARITLCEDREKLIELYTLSLQQELVNHYLFEEPHIKITPVHFTTHTKEKTWHTGNKLVVVYVKYAV